MRSARGFSLIEVVIALAILVGAVGSVAQITLYSARASDTARRITLESALAADKLSQLRGLTWSVDESGQPVSDRETDLTIYPERSSGGTGLQSSPVEALDRNTTGYCDFLDERGRPLGGGETAPPNTAFVRRWSIAPLPAAPADGIVLQIRVLPLESAIHASAKAVLTVTTLRTRLAP